MIKFKFKKATPKEEAKAHIRKEILNIVSNIGFFGYILLNHGTFTFYEHVVHTAWENTPQLNLSILIPFFILGALNRRIISIKKEKQ